MSWKETIGYLEGPRGATYFLAIVSVAAPTSLASFLLDPATFYRIDLSKLLLLAGALGTLCLCCGMLQAVVEDRAPSAGQQKLEAEERFHGVIFMGSVSSVLVQFLALATTLVLRARFGDAFGFRTWALIATVLSVALLVTAMVSTEIREKRANKRAASGGNPTGIEAKEETGVSP